MATRRTGSRRLVVDGVAYRWRIRKRATYSQTDYGSSTLHIAVELAEQSGTVLVLYTDLLHPAGWGGTRQVVQIRPSDVTDWVRQALIAGWIPSLPGPQFLLHVVSAPDAEHSPQ